MSHDKKPEDEMAKYGVEISPELEKSAQDVPELKECPVCHLKLANHQCPEGLN